MELCQANRGVIDRGGDINTIRADAGARFGAKVLPNRWPSVIGKLAFCPSWLALYTLEMA